MNTSQFSTDTTISYTEKQTRPLWDSFTNFDLEPQKVLLLSMLTNFDSAKIEPSRLNAGVSIRHKLLFIITFY